MLHVIETEHGMRDSSDFRMNRTVTRNSRERRDPSVGKRTLSQESIQFHLIHNSLRDSRPLLPRGFRGIGVGLATLDALLDLVNVAVVRSMITVINHNPSENCSAAVAARLHAKLEQAAGALEVGPAAPAAGEEKLIIENYLCRSVDISI